MNRREFLVKAMPRRQAYDQLIDFCASKAAIACVMDMFATSRKNRDARTRVLNLFGSNLLRIEKTDSWPGTVVSQPYDRWHLQVDRHLADTLKLLATGLDQWVSPNLPEDLHFFREDQSVLLASVAHEEMAWMFLSEAEAESSELGLIELAQEP